MYAHVNKAPVAPLLAQAGVKIDDADAHELLAQQMSEHVRVSARTIAQWAAGKPLEGSVVLRAFIAVLDVPRRVVFDHLAPTTLLPALWCPALGEQLRLRRIELGLSPDDVGGAGCSAASVRRWEKASTVPRPSVLAAYLTRLELSAVDLLAYGDWPPAHLPTGHQSAFGAWLAQVRIDLDVSESELARRLGITQPTINAWARGRGNPDRATWETLSQRFTELGAPISVDQLRRMQLPERPSQTDLADAGAFARLLTEARLGQAMCQEVAADLCGVPVSTYRAWERDRHGAKVEMIGQIVAAMGIDRFAAAEALRTDDEETRRDIGASMRYLRLASGIRNRDLARQLGVHRNIVHRIEQGYVEVPGRLFEPIAAALDVPITTVLEWSTEPDPERVAVAKAIRFARQRRGWTQQQLADRIGLDQRAVSGFELAGAVIPDAARDLLGV